MSSDITRYRAELDGLRAVAVISVLLYHAKLSVFGYELFKGGFLGVDIFFVLSGFLITTIIFSKMNNGTFSLNEFFIRRIKRILPAMIFVLLSSSIFAVIFLLFLISLILSNFLAYRQPNFAFYMLPSRMWELMAGSIVAIIISENRVNVKRPQYRNLPVIGFVLIILSIIFIDDKILHPSIITLIPILGTCLIILFSREQDIASYLLSLKPMIFIGAISYSIYLWHQPLFVFYRVKIGEISVLMAIILVLLSIIFSVLSFYLIEKPFRKKQLSRWKWVAIIVSSITLILFSIFVLLKNSSADQTDNLMSPLAKKMYEDFRVPEFRRLKGNSKGSNYLSDKKALECTNRNPLEACRFGDES